MGLQACVRNAYGQNGEGGIIVMDKIVQAIPLEDYKIQIKSSSGVTGIFDVKPCLKGGAFKALEDKGYFSQAPPAHYGIAWPNGQDFSADTLIWDIQHPHQETA